MQFEMPAGKIQWNPAAETLPAPPSGIARSQHQGAAVAGRKDISLQITLPAIHPPPGWISMTPRRNVFLR
jgi:hypothetical protein